MSLLKTAWSNLARRLWEEEAVERLDNHQREFDQLQDRVSTSFKGQYDQVADIKVIDGLPLETADNYLTGDFFRCSVTGTFSTLIPELTGREAGPGDLVMASGTQGEQATSWAILVLSSGYLSREVDDTAAGVITFTQTPKITAAAPVDPDDVTRKDYADTKLDEAAADLLYAKLVSSNTFTGLVQSIQQADAFSRAAWALRNEAATLVAEMYHNADTNVVGLGAYGGRNVSIQPGFSGSTLVGQPTFESGAGELSVENSIYSGANVYADSNQELMRESDALAVFAYTAYGGLSLATPGVGAAIGAGWETVDFDAVVPTTPRSVTANTTTNTIGFHADGVYALSISINVLHNSLNAGRSFDLRFWNVTEGARIGNIIVVTTGRQADGSHMSFTTLIEIGEAQKNHPIRLEVGNTSDTYTAVLWDVAEMVAWSVGEHREPLPSDT